MWMWNLFHDLMVRSWITAYVIICTYSVWMWPFSWLDGEISITACIYSYAYTFIALLYEIPCACLKKGVCGGWGEHYLILVKHLFLILLCFVLFFLIHCWVFPFCRSPSGDIYCLLKAHRYLMSMTLFGLVAGSSQSPARTTTSKMTWAVPIYKTPCHP